MTVDDYYWNYSHIMIQLMIRDATKVIYLSEKQAKKYKQFKRKQNNKVALPEVTDDPDVFCAALGIPTFG